MRAGALCALALLGGCNHDDDLIRADVQLIALTQGEPQAVTIDRVVRAGRRALPSIEAALHTADPAGRKNLILLLRRIGDAEAVPLLRHVTLHDATSDVQREALWTLRGWAAGPRDDRRAERARAALRQIDEQRQIESAG